MFRANLICAFPFQSTFIGEIYVQAQELFDGGMYTQLLVVIDSAITEANVANQNFEAEFVCHIFYFNYFYVLFDLKDHLSWSRGV